MAARRQIDDSRAPSTCPGRLQYRTTTLGLVHDPIINQTFCFGWRQRKQVVGGRSNQWDRDRRLGAHDDSDARQRHRRKKLNGEKNYK